MAAAVRPVLSISAPTLVRKSMRGNRCVYVCTQRYPIYAHTFFRPCLIKEALKAHSVLILDTRRLSCAHRDACTNHTRGSLSKDHRDPKHTNTLAGCRMRVSGSLTLHRRTPVSGQDDAPPHRTELRAHKQPAGERRRRAEGQRKRE